MRLAVTPDFQIGNVRGWCKLKGREIIHVSHEHLNVRSASASAWFNPKHLVSKFCGWISIRNMDRYDGNLRLLSSALLKGSENPRTTGYACCKNTFKAVRSAFRMSSSLKYGNTLDTPSFSTRNFWFAWALLDWPESCLPIILMPADIKRKRLGSLAVRTDLTSEFDR